MIEDLDRLYRFAVHVGDGAMEGPHGMDVGTVSARKSNLPENRIWGALDQAHAIDKSGEHTDRIENGKGGYILRFHDAARAVRNAFGFGNGRIIIRAIAKKYGMTWRRPNAPHSSQTRMILYESKRAPPIFLRNLPCVVRAVRFREREHVEHVRRKASSKGTRVGRSCGLSTKIARQWREVGRAVLDPEMLLFVAARFDHRRDCLLRFVVPAQSLDP